MRNDDDMCEIDDKDEFSEGEVKFRSLMSENIKVVALWSLWFITYLKKLRTFQKLILLYAEFQPYV